MKNPKPFIKLQQTLGAGDALNQYIRHIGSGAFAAPPALRRGRPWGDDLLV